MFTQNKAAIELEELINKELKKTASYDVEMQVVCHLERAAKILENIGSTKEAQLINELITKVTKE